MVGMWKLGSGGRLVGDDIVFGGRLDEEIERIVRDSAAAREYRDRLSWSSVSWRCDGYQSP